MFSITYKLLTILQLMPQNTVVSSFELEGYIGIKCVKILYLQSSCLWNMYVLINKSQTNKNGVNSKADFEKLQTSVIMCYSKFTWGRHTNPKLAILPNLAEGCISVFFFVFFSFICVFVFSLLRLIFIQQIESWTFT